MQTIKVLVVDDSAIVREKLTEVLESDSEIKVIASASNPFIAVQKMEVEAPDVITLDLEMPGMDGLTFLEKIMQQHPLPVVICSSMAETNSDNYLKAIQLGAVEIIHKPKLGAREFFEETKLQICDIVKAAASARLKQAFNASALQIDPKLSADAMLKKVQQYSRFETTEKLIMIGASTGGTEALRFILSHMPADSPGIVVVQHMPELFTRSFADSLNQISKITVKEAQDNDTIIRGQALIAPGNKHTLVRRSGARYFVEVKEGPLVNRHRPSVDVLFRSAARFAGLNSVGLILTGMGDDGARGLLEMKEAGAYTIAQDEASSVVFGMPKIAIELGAAEKVLPLEAMPGELIAAAHRIAHR